ncbi:unnamed protein product [Brachionus calyciflorus]|uniref:Dynamin N-terminal domain-containing protein n=1 Tax=Brachionus calyciflorus TaxID=104777 RepID=A0A813TU41_9BILA|nr:unnamed protein product [Brachionus calyciflorus]
MQDLENLEEQLVLFEDALNSSKYLIETFSLENNRIDLKSINDELKNDLDDQLKRIRKRDFEIAAVGKEKSGKSSLLNAWIGFELLPTDSKRCTYTTTEIRSSANVNEQKYLIEYFSKDEFDQLNSQGSASLASKGYDSLLKKENEEIKSLNDQISKYLGKPVVEKNFTSFNQIADELRSAISNPGHARAVKKICIWTPKLTQKENVVLYDVPGYDSPLTLHKEQTKNKLAHVDSILFASPFKTPSLNDCEIEILELSDKNDNFIDIKDKIVVALTNCDAAGSRNQFKKLLDENRQAWKLKNVAEQRIVPVCSIIEAADLKKPELVKAIKDMKDLNGGDSGMATLKKTVNECINDLKYKIAFQRCVDIKNKLNNFFNSIRETIKERFNVDENTELNDTIDDSDMKKLYIEWWAQKWKSIHKNFQKYFYTKIKPNASPDDPSYLNEDDIQFKDIYVKAIESAFNNLEINNKEAQKLVYNSVVHSKIMAPKYGNIEIRKELASEAMLCIGKLTESLNKFLWAIIERMISWMREELWNIPEIRKEMIGEDEKLANSLIQCSFDALIKRLARPATDIFLRFPRAKVERIKVLKEFQMELLVMDKFLINGRLIDRGLYQYLASGKHAKFTYELHHDEVYHAPHETVHNVVEEPKKANIDDEYASTDSLYQEPEVTKKKSLLDKLKKRKKDNSDTISVISMKSNDSETNESLWLEDKQLIKVNNPFEKLVFTPDAENFDQVHNEIQEDLAEFLECIKNSIFYGSGIQRYYNSELENVRRRFIDLENNAGRWWYYIDKHINQKDSKVKIPVPSKADELKNRTLAIQTLKDFSKIIEECYF